MVFPIVMKEAVAMNFELSKEEMDIKMAAREFAEGEIRDIAKEYDQKEEIPEGTLEKGLRSWGCGRVHQGRI